MGNVKSRNKTTISNDLYIDLYDKIDRGYYNCSQRENNVAAGIYNCSQRENKTFKSVSLNHDLGVKVFNHVLNSRDKRTTYSPADLKIYFQMSADPDQMDSNGKYMIEYFFEDKEYELVRYCIDLLSPVPRYIVKIIASKPLKTDLIYDDLGKFWNRELLQSLKLAGCPPLSQKELTEMMDQEMQKIDKMTSRKFNRQLQKFENHLNAYREIFIS